MKMKYNIWDEPTTYKTVLLLLVAWWVGEIFGTLLARLMFS